MDAMSEAKLEAVHPELAMRVHDLVDLLNFPIIVTQGLRTFAQQQAFYNQGRTTPGKIITDAKPEQSAHCFGYAVDVAPTDGHSIDWNGRDAKWQEILSKALSCGLAEGATWRTFPDEPHLYLRELPATPDEAMVEALKEGGLLAVKQLIDSRLSLE
jgi:peptidoglycan L-alanyl-D-glutamate endopeptidase CwlK